MTSPIASLLDLTGQVALVTGASGGIGRVIAQRLASAGAAVAVHYHRNDVSAAAAVDAITAAGGNAIALAGDIAKERDCERIFASIESAFGPVSLLVNNAADQGVHSLASMPLATWRAMMATNLDGTFLTTRLAIDGMIARGAGGAIVNVSSIEGMVPAEGHGHYATSKAGMLMFTRAAALEFGLHGVRVNAVSPGLIDRDGLASDWPSGVARWTGAAPLGRLGTADDIANAVLYLLSPAAAFVTGANLVVDGGIGTKAGW